MGSRLFIPNPFCVPSIHELRLLGKLCFAVETASRLIQHGEVLPRTLLRGTVPLLELSRLVLLR
jgi:hypothetical protein